MIKVYRQGNFSFSHERNDLRKICNLLSENLDEDENVFLLANVELPKVTYRYKIGGETREREIKSSSPDLIVLKNDSIAVVEMKGYPGKIDFPLKNDEIFVKEWTAKFKDFPEQTINEGRRNPYWQVNTNKQAFIAYLIEKEKEFSSEELRGSNWDRSEAFILFTNSSAEFAHSKDERNERGNWYYTFHLGALHNTANGELFSDYIKDMTTGPREYKEDERHEISLSNECIIKLCDLLECIDVTEEYTGEEVEELTDPTISTGIGFSPTLVRGIEPQKNKDLEESFKPSQNILNLPREFRLLSYYQRCLIEESKHNMNIFLDSRRADEKCFVLSGMIETIFSNNQAMKISEKDLFRVHTNLRQANPSLSYGFSLLIDQITFNQRDFWIAEPLFITRVNYRGEAYELAYNNDITINQNVLQRIPPFSKLHHSELDEKIDSIVQANSTPVGIIETIFSEMGLLENNDLDKLMNLGVIDTSNLERGFKPSAGLIFLSESGIYNSLMKELRLIEKNWLLKHEKDEPIDDLAYQLLKGLNFPDHSDWKIPLYNVGLSNYEQSMSIGYAIASDRPLSVVSGPPGTGKTQLAINLIAEMNREDEKILFASRNHKAVDVVVDRYNSFFSCNEAINKISTSGNVSDEETSKFDIKELKQNEKTIINSRIITNNQLLNKIKNLIEEFEEATENIEKANTEIQNILHDNPNLQIINWYIDSPEKLQLDYWEKIFSQFKETEKKSSKILERLIASISESHLSWKDIFNKESFLEKYKEKIFDELEESLPTDVIKKIGRDSLLEFSGEYLPLLVQLEKTSHIYKQYSKIISENDLDELYDRWNKQSKENMENTIKLLDDKFNNAPDKSPIFNTAVTTLSAAKIEKPFKPGVFDLAVMDESSQTDIISSLPIFFRAKRAIIIGDEKQLFPIVSLSEEKDFNTFLAHNLTEEDYYRYGYLHSSLLSVADNEIKRSNQKRTMLKEHFRCHPNIIGFSNRYFYNNDLRIKTDTNNNSGLKWVEHSNDCQPRWSNEGEIAVIIDIISKLLNSKEYSPSQIGVVTPFREQANLLTNHISGQFGDKVGSVLIASTAHRFQGDEREIMIFSLVAGASMRNSTYKWMQEGLSKNLINVGVTRAKKELIVVGNDGEIVKRGGLLKELNDWVKYCNKITDPH